VNTAVRTLDYLLPLLPILLSALMVELQGQFKKLEAGEVPPVSSDVDLFRLYTYCRAAYRKKRIDPTLFEDLVADLPESVRSQIGDALVSIRAAS
jgi:hypothetical protein